MKFTWSNLSWNFFCVCHLGNLECKLAWLFGWWFGTFYIYGYPNWLQMTILVLKIKKNAHGFSIGPFSLSSMTAIKNWGVQVSYPLSQQVANWNKLFLGSWIWSARQQSDEHLIKVLSYGRNPQGRHVVAQDQYDSCYMIFPNK